MQDPVLALKHLDRIQRERGSSNLTLLLDSKHSDLSHSSNHTQEEKIENKKDFMYYGQVLGSQK
jgi:hypothetical protein